MGTKGVFTQSTMEVLSLLATGMRTGDIAKATGLTAQQVSFIKRREKEGAEARGRPADVEKPNSATYKEGDTGCPDGEYPSCLECPLPECKETKERGNEYDEYSEPDHRPAL